MKEIALVVSCEHAVNTVPEPYQALFTSYHEQLASHRGLDPGAQAIAFSFSQYFECDLVQAQATRLLIDCNRSLHHRNCFSEVTALLSKEEKNQLIQQYYLPFRQRVEEIIKNHIQQRKLVLHLSIHSFTPVLNNDIRNADVGLLYDPKRNNEKRLAQLWQQLLKQHHTGLRVRLNYPYRGVSDGFTSALRKRFLDNDYAGIEVESNQTLIANEESFASLCNLLTLTLNTLITQPVTSL
ncbi:N-formylglutamate amidohydrolase [Legionella maceachernii]|uniref:N-formylglutamate amidohydrolase n=1 Tax=Legionella maceachernii TaxID=466 RepID=A0A0W0W4B7_9GAMM|nr:N-formylglutamate amidohydrolase [Legionella maceachernii]KTD27054.1 N-formylglutamate amidohydrolase [Legionella maceachernii]SKA04125.1 Predicted N-formylglutamate amidohydrolase [Legionella maceachernii]SUP00245.1 Predicted N-formylglutamate amidohydrolase [Legionella maceachernii]